ncbi:hypothetical protein BC834DRAFT_361166 [Gloeopeniophorella convolvens]|nr:hypothetical protein BC834DRAFT_361166 [Gloeopeniophorella convolvens]
MCSIAILCALPLSSTVSPVRPFKSGMPSAAHAHPCTLASPRDSPIYSRLASPVRLSITAVPFRGSQSRSLWDLSKSPSRDALFVNLLSDVVSSNITARTTGFRRSACSQ